MNLDEIRNKLKEVQTKTTKKSNLWKPEGKTVIRILPYKLNKDNPFIELYFHYGINNKTLLSPLSFGNPDPIAEFAEKLKSTGNKEDWKLGRKLDPKMRTFVPIIIRGKESEGVKYWGFGIQTYEELLSIISDPDYGDITDIATGTDIIVDRKTPEEAGNQYGNTTIRPKRNQTPLTKNRAELTKWLTEQEDITQIYKEPTYEELQAELKKWLNPDEEIDTVEATKVDDLISKDKKNDISDILAGFEGLMEEE